IDPLTGCSVAQRDDAESLVGAERRERLEPDAMTPLPEDIVGGAPAERPADVGIDLDLLAEHFSMALADLGPKIRAQETGVLSGRGVEPGRTVDARRMPRLHGSLVTFDAVR